MIRKTRMARHPTSLDPVIVRVPFVIHRRGRRRTMKLSGEPTATNNRVQRPNSAVVHALAKAFRWRKLLETGVYSTPGEIAVAEKINDSYVCRILRLTLLAPEIVEAVLDGRQDSDFGFARAMRPFPVEWKRQQILLCGRL